MPERIPLPTLLSHALVAMTIGIDYEYEQRVPHSTTMGVKRGAPKTGPWLTSWANWANLLRFVPPEGLSLPDLRACPGVVGTGLKRKNPDILRWYARWGWVTIEGGVITLRPILQEASVAVVPLLAGLVEARWADHLGAGLVDDLRDALGEVLSQADQQLPHYLPPLDNLLWTKWNAPGRRVDAIDQLKLIDRLGQVLLLYVLDHEEVSAVPLAMAANLLRVIEEDGTPTKDLVRRSGVSKEAVGYLTGWRQKPRLTVETSPHTLTLTPDGSGAKAEYLALPVRIERDWARRYGKNTMQRLRRALDRVVVDATLAESPLAELVKAPEDCWRSWVRKPETLPHFPMLLHRGCWPDGA